MITCNYKWYTLLYYLVIFSCFTACNKKENIKTVRAKPEKVLSDREAISPYNRIRIVHLYNDTVYTLPQEFIRESGEQLIIDEGTVIKGVNFTIRPGGVIIANGTAEKPVVFTSNSLPGNQADQNAGIRITGRSTNNSLTTVADPSDFSGTLRYVRIEFANLSLQSVGDRTVIENVMVSYARPSSSFIINGGTFNAKNLVSYACAGPSDYYITRGYTGKMQRILAYRHPFFGSRGNDPSNALCGVFIENNPVATLAKTARPATFPVISNLTVWGPGLQNGIVPLYKDTSLSSRSAALITTGSTSLLIRNSILAGFPGTAWYLDDSLTANNLEYVKSEFKHSIVWSDYDDRVFYLLPGRYRPFVSISFRNFMTIVNEPFKNRIFSSAGEFALEDPFNYGKPGLQPREGSPVLTGADFTGANYSDPFFNKVDYIGAFGMDNWLQGWTNFTPLKTNYNFPE